MSISLKLSLTIPRATTPKKAMPITVAMVYAAKSFNISGFIVL